MLGQVQRNDDRVRSRYRIWRGSCEGELWICKCARTIQAGTIAKIERHANQEHKEQDQKIQRQTNLHMVVYCYVMLVLTASACVTTLCYSLSVT